MPKVILRNEFLQGTLRLTEANGVPKVGIVQAIHPDDHGPLKPGDLEGDTSFAVPRL